MHHARWLRTGDPHKTRRRPNGSGTMSHGRRTLRAPGHPIAPPCGAVFHARLVLFDKIGYGPHRCRWCATPINWHAGLTADHIDGDSMNDDPVNLVESCLACNGYDGAISRWHGRRKRIAA